MVFGLSCLLNCGFWTILVKLSCLLNCGLRTMISALWEGVMGKFLNPPLLDRDFFKALFPEFFGFPVLPESLVVFLGDVLSRLEPFLRCNRIFIRFPHFVSSSGDVLPLSFGGNVLQQLTLDERTTSVFLHYWSFFTCFYLFLTRLSVSSERWVLKTPPGVQLSF